MKRTPVYLFLTLCLFSTVAQNTTEKECHNRYGNADITNPEQSILLETPILFDHWLRDTWIAVGPDNTYYLTGTTAATNRNYNKEPHCWDWNDGIYLWKSKDLKNWESMGLIWSFEKDATWQKEPFTRKQFSHAISVNGDSLENKFRALWAPELHYIKSLDNWFIVACLNNSKNGKGSFILKSTSGKPEGPYVNIDGNAEKPLFPYIDGSLFEDTDGTVYFLCLDKYIARMKKDMSGLDEDIREIQQTEYPFEPYIEGVSIFKHNGKYHLVQAIWSHVLPDGTQTYATENKTETCYSYDCIIAESDCVYGPYSYRYNAITGGGHNNFFQTPDGLWWATAFFNPRGKQALEFKQCCRPAIIPMKYSNGKFMPDKDKLKQQK